MVERLRREGLSAGRRWAMTRGKMSAIGISDMSKEEGKVHLSARVVNNWCHCTSSGLA